MASTPVLVPEIKVDEAQIADLQLRSPTLLKQAEEFAIENEDDYAGSLTLVEIANNAETKIDEFFKEPTNLAFRLHRSLTARINFLKAPFVQARNEIKYKRQQYRDEQERIRRKQEEEQRAAAKKAADDQALKDAEALAAQGEHEAADQVLEQAAKAPAPAVVVQSTVQKQSGTILKKVWKFRIDNPEQVPEAYKIIDDTKIRRVVTALGDKHGIPGVTAYQEDQEGFRRA